MFSQLLGVFSREEFSAAVKKHAAEKGAKGFDCWTQLVAMLFCQLGRAHSLREICSGLASVEGRLTHLGVGRAPVRSTLSYANGHRPPELFEEIFHRLLAQCRGFAPGKPFRFKHKLFSLDASVIDLCANMFDWAKYQRTKGAIKLHLLPDHDGCLPWFVQMTEGKQHEIHLARQLEFPRNAIVVFDRGYLDFDWMKSLEDRDVYFVTRAKTNLIWCDEGDLPGPPQQPDPRVLSDKLVTLAGAPNVLWRRIEWQDPETGKVLVFLTNQLELSATTIAEIYRQRWQIEIFFKTIKQNLKIKSFVGTSANAVQIQIWTAMIAILLLKFLQFRSRIGWSLSNLVALLRLNLFLHKDLWEWIDAPFDLPLDQGANPQPELAFT